MAQLNVRLDDHTRESLDALARARGVTGSDLIRGLIDAALGRGGDDSTSDDVTPRSLSAVDRLTLAQQHEILGLLTTEPGEVEHHRYMVEVLNRGFTMEYSDLFRQLSVELSERECMLVNDIFDMFRILGHSLEQISAEDRAALGEHAEHSLTFSGFDFNDSQELRMAQYARYLISTDRWTELAERFDDEHERGNSHMPMLATYQRMLTVWKPIWEEKMKGRGGINRFLFTAPELQEILRAWIHPDNR